VQPGLCALTSDPSNRASPRCSTRLAAGSCTDAFVQRGVPLPGRASRPVRAVGLPSAARQRSWGSYPSQVCSRIGWRSHLCDSGPTCLFSLRRPTRLIFVGLIRRLSSELAIKRGGESGAWMRWLLGFDPFCGPCRGHSTPAVVPALGFASRRHSGTGSCIRVGSTPHGSSVPGLPGS